MSTISTISYTHFQNPSETLEVKKVPNTIANIGGHHMEIFNKQTGSSGLVLELAPAVARYVNLSDRDQAAKFESLPMKQKFQLQLSTMTPEVLTLKPAQLERLRAHQNDAIDTLEAINELCIKAMWEDPNTLKKQKATIRKTLMKQGVPKSEIENKAWIAFLNGGQTGISTEGDDIEIKTKCAAYRYSKASDTEFELRVPRLISKETGEQVNFTATPINRGSVICAQIRVKPYVTPNGAYGTTYIYVNGHLLKNGPDYSGHVSFTDWGLGDESEEEPKTKRVKVDGEFSE